MAAARNNIKETIKQRQQAELDLNETITQETLSNFVITDGGNSLAWPIGQASLLPSAYGEMTIKVPIAAVAKYLQNPTARRLANIPKPPEPKPNPAPAAPTATNSGNKVITYCSSAWPPPSEEKRASSMPLPPADQNKLDIRWPQGLPCP